MGMYWPPEDHKWALIVHSIYNFGYVLRKATVRRGNFANQSFGVILVVSLELADGIIVCLMTVA